MTHYEWSHTGKLPVMPCSAHDVTFGGRCLNCGYNPDLFAIPCVNHWPLEKEEK